MVQVNIFLAFDEKREEGQESLKLWHTFPAQKETVHVHLASCTVWWNGFAPTSRVRDQERRRDEGDRCNAPSRSSQGSTWRSAFPYFH